MPRWPYQLPVAAGAAAAGGQPGARNQRSAGAGDPARRGAVALRPLRNGCRADGGPAVRGRTAGPPRRRPASGPEERTAVIATGCAAVAVLGAGALRSSGRQGPNAPPAVQTAEAAQLPSVPKVVAPTAQRLPRRPRPRRRTRRRPNRNPPPSLWLHPRPRRRSRREPPGFRQTRSAARSGRCSTADDSTKARAASSDSSPRIPTRRGRGSRLGCSTIESTGAASPSGSGAWPWRRIPRSGKTRNSVRISASCWTTPGRRPA